ncbi:MAG: DUF2845 domain-containing protein [Lentisphaeria bacterium]|nr:DUF2845 domain-containing protein [Lentisphaeria bacterium]
MKPTIKLKRYFKYITLGLIGFSMLFAITWVNKTYWIYKSSNIKMPQRTVTASKSSWDKLHIGMTQEEVMAHIPLPDNRIFETRPTYKITSDNTVRENVQKEDLEIWVYDWAYPTKGPSSYSKYLYFTEGKLTVISNPISLKKKMDILLFKYFEQNL